MSGLCWTSLEAKLPGIWPWKPAELPTRRRLSAKLLGQWTHLRSPSVSTCHLLPRSRKGSIWTLLSRSDSSSSLQIVTLASEKPSQRLTRNLNLRQHCLSSKTTRFPMLLPVLPWLSPRSSYLQVLPAEAGPMLPFSGARATAPLLRMPSSVRTRFVVVFGGNVFDGRRRLFERWRRSCRACCRFVRSLAQCGTHVPHRLYSRPLAAVQR